MNWKINKLEKKVIWKRRNWKKKDKETGNLLPTQEEQSRRNNIQVEGIADSPLESWNDAEEKLNKLLKEHLDRKHIYRKGTSEKQKRKIK